MMLLLLFLAATWADIRTAPCTQYASPEGSGWDCTAERPCSLYWSLQQYAQCGHTVCLHPGTYQPRTPTFRIRVRCRLDVPFILRSINPDEPAHICTYGDRGWLEIDGTRAAEWEIHFRNQNQEPIG